MQLSEWNLKEAVFDFNIEQLEVFDERRNWHFQIVMATQNVGEAGEHAFRGERKTVSKLNKNIPK